jgi:transcriptional regulator with XRE-family HTH domain
MENHTSAVIKKIRLEHNLTQAALAEAVGVSPGHIGTLEQGSAKPSFDLMGKFVLLYNVDANNFYGRTQYDARPEGEGAVLAVREMISNVQEYIESYMSASNQLSNSDKEQDTSTGSE